MNGSPAYHLDRVEGAKHLLVTFAGLSVGAAPPRVHEGRRLPPVLAHRLYLGSGPGLVLSPLAPEEESTTRQVVTDIAAELKVPPARIICWGHSYAGVVALAVGLSLSAGHIIVGGPAIRIMTWAQRLGRSRRGDPEQIAMRRHLLSLAGIDEDPTRVQDGDTRFLRAAQAITVPCSIDIFVSPEDPVYAEVCAFRDSLAGHPWVRVSLTEGVYGRHGELKLPYTKHLISRLRRLLPEQSAVAEPAGAGWQSSSSGLD